VVMIRFTLQAKRSFATIADSGLLMRRSTCITWKFARFRHRERGSTPARHKCARQGLSISASGPAFNVQARTPRREQNLKCGYWSTLSKMAKDLITGLLNNSKSGNYYLHVDPRKRIQDARELLIDEGSQGESTTRIADPYGLIHRWKSRTQRNSPKLPT